MRNKKRKDKKKSTDNGVIVLNIDKSVSDYLTFSFPNSAEKKGDYNPFKKEYSCDYSICQEHYKISFIINEVFDVTYLDVVVNGETKAKAIQCLEQVHRDIFSSGVRRDFIDIVSYDAVSEYYCNKILPKLNNLERNLRKLLFDIYIVNFEHDYYQTTISKEIQEKIKSVIKASGNKKNKETQYLQQFFYSFELNDIQRILFTQSWTEYDEQLKNSFLETHKNLSNLSDEELRTAFSEFTIKCDWERFFADKINIADIEKMINDMRIYRNSIAHFKLFNKTEYKECNLLIGQLNKAVIKAIEITEDKEFAEKNSKHILSAMSKLSEILKEFTQSITQTISKNMAITLQTLETEFTSFSENVKEPYTKYHCAEME